MSRASQPVTATYTSAQTGVVLLPALARVRYLITGVIFTAHANNSASPAMCLSIGGIEAIKHPGVPAGGGLVATDLDAANAQGDAVTFDCEAPTGGSVTVTVFYKADS